MGSAVEGRSVVFNHVCFFLECGKSMVKVLCFKVHLSSPLFGVLRKDSTPASLLIGFPKTEKICAADSGVSRRFRTYTERFSHATR